MVRGILLGLALALAASAAHAARPDLTKTSAGYVYFYRPGADIVAHDEALKFCFDQAIATKQPDPTMNGTSTSSMQYGIIGVLVESLVESAIDGAINNRGFAVNLENCMVATGWQVVQLPAADGKRIFALPQAAKHQALADLLARPQPAGQIVRRFNNDIQHPETYWLQAATDMDRSSLSVLAYNVEPWRADYRAASLKAERELKEKQKAEKAAAKAGVKPAVTRPPDIGPVPVEQWGNLPTDRSYVLLRTLRPEGWPTGRLLFRRFGDDPGRLAWETDGKTDLFFIDLPVNKKVKKGGLVEFSAMLELPPGRWTLMGVYGNMMTALGPSSPITVSFCLGAPSFELKAGEVLFAGTFGIGILEGQIAPDTNFSTIKHLTDATPGLLPRLQAAPWTNGTRFACDGTIIYALETPGRPFEPGYRFGSMATQPPPVTPGAAAPTPPSSPAPAPASDPPAGARP